MRALLVVLAALVAAPAAFAHAEIEPTSIPAGTATPIHLTVPTESDTAETIEVRVTAPAPVTLTGTTDWRGHTRGDVKLTFTARADRGGDYALRVEQRYSDGRVVTWAGDESSDTPAPVLHVQGAENGTRDRVIIVAVALAAGLVVLALRRRRKR